ncbi:MAG: hypothetical protein ACOC43_10075 [Desulfohalobiaceae bacterium]
MDAVTYPNLKVSKYVSENLIPLRIGHDEQPYATDFKVKWTPKMFILDPEGNSHHEVLGFLPPEEILPFCLLGQAKQAFNNSHLEQTIQMLDSLLQESRSSGSAPEATFLRGVSHFKKSHDPNFLKEVYRSLKFDYPHSSWAQRGFPYWNL